MIPCSYMNERWQLAQVDSALKVIDSIPSPCLLHVEVSLSKILNSKIAPGAASSACECAWLVISFAYVAPSLSVWMRAWNGARLLVILHFPGSATRKVVHIPEKLANQATRIPRTRLSHAPQPSLCSLQLPNHWLSSTMMTAFMQLNVLTLPGFHYSQLSCSISAWNLSFLLMNPFIGHLTTILKTLSTKDVF